MIRFVVRKLCLRNQDDPSVVNGMQNNQEHSRTTDYLNVSEKLRVNGSDFCEAGDIPVASGCIISPARPGITVLPDASVQLAALHTTLFLSCGKFP
jgi:hypothetical protein